MMDPHHWGVLQQLQRCMQRSQHNQLVNNNNNNINNNNINSSCESNGATSRTSSTWDPYSDYPQFPAAPQGGDGGGGGGVEWEQLGAAPDGEEMGTEEDLELARKRKELQDIEERIVHKKASIVMKTMGLFAGGRGGGAPAAAVPGGGGALRRRAMEILQQRHSPGFFPKVRPPPDRTPRPSAGRHPLRLRVEALRKQRSVEPEAPPPQEVVSPPPPPTPAVTPSSNREVAPSSNRGIAPSSNRHVVPSSNWDVAPPSSNQDVAPSSNWDVAPSSNRGIAPSSNRHVVPSSNWDVAPPSSNRDVAPSSNRTVVPSSNWDVAPPSSNRGVAPPSSNRDVVPSSNRDVPPLSNRDNASRGFERFLSVLNKGVDIDLLSRIVTDDSEDLPSVGGVPDDRRRGEESESRRPDGGEEAESGRERPSPPLAEEVKGEGGRSRSKSPEMEEEEGEEPKQEADPQQQLQNILRSLGLDLEVDELSKVADRTQERLYGKRSERRAEAGRRSHGEHSRSSSSSSSSHARSPSADRRSLNGDLRAPETDAALDYQLPCRAPDAPDVAFLDPSVSRYCPDEVAYAGWTPSPGAGRSPFSPDQRPYPQYSFGVPSAPRRCPHGLRDFAVPDEWDLARSEGQSGSGSDGRCLTVIRTERRPPKRRPRTPPAALMDASPRKRRCHAPSRHPAPRTLPQASAPLPAPPRTPALPPPASRGQQQPEAPRPRPPTEEEVKANLRKTLEAFNRKAKSSRPAVAYCGAARPDPLTSMME